MADIPKKIVTDESNQPVAVLIDYEDWLQIERRLAASADQNRTQDLRRFEGVLKLREDPVEFQRRIRGEWP
jgi:hypothetical protein